LSAVTNRYGQMHSILQGDVRSMLHSRDGALALFVCLCDV
jgi:hypothetical protein